MTKPELIRTEEFTTRDQPLYVARLQRPASGTSQPPLPDPGLPGTAADAVAVPGDSAAVDDMATGPLQAAAPPIPAGVAPAGDGGSPGLWSLSSIARNRLANRARVAALSNSGSMLADAAAGRLTPAPLRPPAGGVSSNLRNRLQAEGDQQGNYPDIHADPSEDLS